ncbi:B12-binding domain-containing protein [Micromonospora sp. M42]|uniref:B12-binding domain-containing protein n=1 Tax=Micromonospora sp. M42 TaxID=457406 RepID=UPI000A8DE7D2|nr:B12-binding domain-containing protein [Micromonospora sp. M42]
MSPEHRIGPETLAAYLDHLDRADRAGAIALAQELLADGVPVADILVDLVAVAQQEIGRRWLTGSWSVARSTPPPMSANSWSARWARRSAHRDVGTW